MTTDPQSAEQEIIPEWLAGEEECDLVKLQTKYLRDSASRDLDRVGLVKRGVDVTRGRFPDREADDDAI